MKRTGLTPAAFKAFEVIGDGHLLADPELAEVNRLAGEAARHATTAEALQLVADVFWFTMAFGVAWVDDELQAYGAGSSLPLMPWEKPRIAESAPVDDPLVFLTSGGSHGVETAAKIVRRHFAMKGQPERTVIVSRDRAYHGTHTYGTALGGIAADREGWGSLISDVAKVPSFDVGALEATIRGLGPDRVATFFVEPVFGAGGVFPPPDNYLREVAAVCRAHGVPGLQRGGHRGRPDGPMVGVRPLRRQAGSDDPGQGPHLRLPAARRGGRLGIGRRAVPRGRRGDAAPRLHVLRARHRLRGGARQPRHHEAGRTGLRSPSASRRIEGLLYNHTVQQTFWNPFSQRARTHADAVTFVSGDRSTLEDSDGRQYLDATGGLWYSLIGHGRSEMAQAVSRQMTQLEACSCFDVYASKPTLDLADQLAERVPVHDPLVFFSSNGSDSIDTAAKVALLYWDAVGQPERRHLLHREGSYHGMHGFGTSLAGIPSNRHPGSITPETHIVPMFDLPATEARIDAIGADRVAAVFAEPVIGAGGVFPPPDGYLRGLADLCRRSGCLLVVDEVVTGFGRTGEYLASAGAGIEPDILIVAKGLTSGYLPLSAAIFNGTIAGPFDGEDGRWLRHGYTYSGHATACAAGLENLAIIDDEKLVGRVRELAPVLRDALAPLIEHELVSEIRSIGLTAAVQFDPRVQDAPSLVIATADVCRRLGVLTRGLASNALHVSPPFVIEEAEIHHFADVFDAALTEVEGARSSVTSHG